MRFRTYKIKEFDDLVDCIWFLEHNGANENVLTPPNQYSNITFPLGTSYKRHNQKITTPQIEGIDQKPVIFQHSDGNKIIGIRFLPFGLYSFHNSNMTCLANSTTELTEIIGNHALIFLERLKNASNDFECVAILKSLLCQLFKPERYKKIQVTLQSYYYFKKSSDNLKLHYLNEELELSYPTLNRHFVEVIGISPKKIERLLKFRKSICTMTSFKTDLTSVGFQSGYFDQAHFIREFSHFMDCKPNKFYQSLKAQHNAGETKICYNFSIF